MRVLTLVAESCDATALFSRQSEDIGQKYRIVQYLETRFTMMEKSFKKAIIGKKPLNGYRKR